MADYVNNERLRKIVNIYNRLNINDKGEWCAAYSQRLDNKLNAGKTTPEKYKQAHSFIVNKVKTIEKLQKRYYNYSPERKREFNRTFEKIKNEMCNAFIKIINGRVNSFRLRTTLKNYDDVDDIIQDAFLCVLGYINRYDDARCSSCFAYITQLATNSIILSLNNIKERENTLVSGLDFFENINTIDEQQGTSGLKKFLED